MFALVLYCQVPACQACVAPCHALSFFCRLVATSGERRHTPWHPYSLQAHLKQSWSPQKHDTFPATFQQSVWRLLAGLQRVCGEEEELRVDPALVERMLEDVRWGDGMR